MGDVAFAEDCIDPRYPTRHRPGSEGKVALLILRAALGLPLFHPLDAGMAELKLIHLFTSRRDGCQRGRVSKAKKSHIVSGAQDEASSWR
jgi:hypothetical protein